MKVTRKLEVFSPVNIELESQDEIDAMYYIVARFCEKHTSQFASVLKMNLSVYMSNYIIVPK